MLDYVSEPKEVRRVLKLEEGSHLSYFKAGGIKVCTRIKKKSEGVTTHIGLNKNLLLDRRES